MGLRFTLSLALLLPTLACGEAAPGGRAGSTATVDTIDGVEILRYPRDPAPHLEWGFDTLAVVGGAAAEDAAHQFDQVAEAGLAGDEAGHLYVLDGSGHRILRYDSSGRHVATYGSEGAGPGELQGPSVVAVAPDGTIWVSDAGNRRTSVFDPGGGVRAELPFPADDIAPSGELVPLGEGVRAGWLQTLTTFFFQPGEERSPDVPLVRFGPDGRILDTLWTAPAVPRTSVTVDGPSGPLFLRLSRAFFPQFHWAARAGSGPIAVSDSADYLIHLLSVDGTPLRSVWRDPPARRLREADREAASARIREQAGSSIPRIPGFPSAEAITEARLANLEFHPTMPRIQGLQVDPRGRLWVGVSGETPGGAVDRIDVYTSAGRLVGEWRDPPFFPDLLFGDGLAEASTATRWRRSA